jgi:predicted RNA binding protein YcfA (HicA-like mRNA interferase family)
MAALCRAGWVIARQKGSHVVLRKAGKPNLVIPMHRTVAPFLLLSQVRRAGLSEEEFLDLLG